VAQSLTAEALAANAPLADVGDTQMAVAETYVVRVRTTNVLYDDLAVLHVLASADSRLQAVVKPLADVLRIFRVKPLEGVTPGDVLRVSTTGTVFKPGHPAETVGQGESVDVTLDLDSYKTFVSFLSDVVQLISTVVGWARLQAVDIHRDVANVSTALASSLLSPHIPQLSAREVQGYTLAVSEVVSYALTPSLGMGPSGKEILAITSDCGVSPRQILTFDGLSFLYMGKVNTRILEVESNVLRECEQRMKSLKARLYTEIKVKMAQASAAGDDEFGELLDV
jgi:hypothetical protein